ncbi:MAG: TetR/AcrR family transcriptional regulator [Kiritimatiellae bacterium]|nr:TetR/AcrR family transcriptional regulator [Kiritimatiellia bacterium]
MKAPVHKPSPKPYHHGNLREAVIETAARMADAEDIQALSLRQVAQKLQVSHTAPYHHFKNKAELIAAIADAGLSRLEAELKAACERSAEAPPREQLRALGMAYIRFAQAHPHYFRVMFRPDLFKEIPVSETEPPDRSFLVLIDVLQRHVGETGAPSSHVLNLALFAWSTVHGLASLWIDGSLADTPPYVTQTLDDLANRVMDQFEQCL